MSCPPEAERPRSRFPSRSAPTVDPRAALSAGGAIVQALPPWAMALIAGDAMLIGLDVLHRNDVLDDPRFLVTHERGFGEIFQYVKGTGLALALLMVASARRSASALLLAAIIGWIVIDDAFALHERAGRRLASWWGDPSLSPLRAVDGGELLFLGAIGLAAAFGLVAAWVLRPTAERPTLLVGGAGLLILGFFGAGMDVLHALAREHWLRPALAVIEDGGEMVALTGLLAAVVHVHWRLHGIGESP